MIGCCHSFVDVRNGCLISAAGSFRDRTLGDKLAPWVDWMQQVGRIRLRAYRCGSCGSRVSARQVLILMIRFARDTRRARCGGIPPRRTSLAG